MNKYLSTIKESRKAELALKTSLILETLNLLKEISLSLETAINNAAIDGTLRKEQLAFLKERVEYDLGLFQSSYDDIVQRGISGSTGLILDRNGKLFAEVGGASEVIDILRDKVLLEVIQAKGRDGLILSDRVWRITEESKLAITTRVQQGMLLGETHTRVANDIRQYLIGTGGMKYRSERLVLSEFSRAYKVANELSVQTMRENSDFMWFEKWELSPAHKGFDACDVLAEENPLGEGGGVYERAPNRHPGCYCYIYPVFRKKRTTKVFENVSGVLPNANQASDKDIELANDLRKSNE